MELRDYQAATVSAVWDYLRGNPGKNPVGVVPTGGGKSAIIGSLCRDALEMWAGRIIVLSHVQELVEQLDGTLRKFLPAGTVGTCAAGLGSRDLDHQVLVGQIQTVARVGAVAFGRRDLVIVDEAQLVPFDGEGQYRTFLADIQAATPHARLIGMTATPYRLDSGPICTPGGLFNEICHEVGVRDLIDAGYLSKLVTRCGSKKTAADLSGVAMRGGDYVLEQLGKAMSRGTLVEDTVSDLVGRTADRKSVLIFSPTIAHAELVVEFLRKLGQPAGLIQGGTGGLERGWMIDEFRRGILKYLVNVQCLTIGFDAPGVDCVALLRPTESIALYAQMVGRGFRLSPNKSDCLVLDYAGLINRHGPVDLLRPKVKRKGEKSDPPMKVCQECGERSHAGCSDCPFCGQPFPEGSQDHKHNEIPDELPVVSEERPIDEDFEIGEIVYAKHFPKDRGDGRTRIPSLRVSYYARRKEFETGLFGGRTPHKWPIVSEYICLDHTGFPKIKAVNWWKARSNYPVPTSVDEGLKMAEAGLLSGAVEITVRRKTPESFPEVVKASIPTPAEVDPDELDAVLNSRAVPLPSFMNTDDDLPF